MSRVGTIGIDKKKNGHKKMSNKKVWALTTPKNETWPLKADRFAVFFKEKIEKIRHDLPVVSQLTVSLPPSPVKVNLLEPATADELRDIIKRSKSTSCSLDPIPTWLFKGTLDATLPFLITLINSSLSEGVVPDEMKIARVKPLLKSPKLDPNELKNYRPVSNLSYISKLLGRVVARRLNNHMITNGLHEPLQSAYKAGHSTETALLCVHNDVFTNMDNQSATVLVLIDLSAAFDTIDHSVLFDRMENIIGIEGTALNWFRSYLGWRSQRIQIGDVISLISVLLLFGVPQGSVLGPLLYLIYMLPLGEIIRGYGFRLHIYADDTQVYLAIRHETEDIQTVQLQLCLKDIHQWMSSSSLKLNSGKTEVLVMGTYQQLAKLNIQSLNVAVVQVNLQQKPLHNLGVMFDRNMTMSDQVKSLVRSVSYHTRNISRIRRDLTIDSTKKLVNSLVTSRLDYSNSLLVGVTDGLLQRLQCAQDWAARTFLQLPRSVEAPLHEFHCCQCLPE